MSAFFRPGSTPVLCAALLLAPACWLFGEPRPDVAEPKRVESHGLSFDYPGNWSHEVQVLGTGEIETVMFTAESAGSAVAMVQQFRPAIEVDAVEMLAGIMKEMGGSVGEETAGLGEFTAGPRSTGTRTWLGQERPTHKARFGLTLMDQRVPHTFELSVAKLEDRTLVVFVQAPDEDLAVATPGFELIFSSIQPR